MGKFRLPGRPAWMTLRGTLEERSFDNHMETEMRIRRREEAFHLGVPEPGTFIKVGNGSRSE